MDWELFRRYLLDFAALYPGAALCIVPVLEFVRAPRRTLPAAAAVLTAMIFANAAVCTRFRFNSNWFLLAELAVVFVFFHRRIVPALPRWRAAFAFLMGTWLLEVSVLLSKVINARAELANTQPVCLASTAILCFVLTAGLGVFYCAVAAPWAAWLLRTFPSERIWRIAWILPALCTACYVFFLPRDPALVLKNRVQEVALIAIFISLLLVFLLLYVFYRSGHEYLARLKLAQENHLLAMESQRYQELRASAVLPPERRWVHVSAQMLSPAMLGLIVENSFDERPNATPAGEGIGLTSVKAVVQKYAGQMTAEREQGVFRVSILLNF